MAKRKSWLEKKVNRKIGAQKRKVKGKVRKAITGTTKRSGCGCLLSALVLVALAVALVTVALAASPPQHLPLILNDWWITPTPTTTPTPTKTPRPTATPTPTPSVMVASYCIYRSSYGGAAYLNGEVWSGIREPVDFVRITANARDAQGTLIWTDWAYAMVDVMEYGQRSPFRMIDWGVLTDIDTMEFVVEWDTAGPSHIGQILEVISSRVVSTGGRIEYVGEARNNTGRVVEYPKAVIGIYNGPGQIIGADWTYGSSTEVQPGETTTFSGSVSGYCGGGGLYLLQVVADYWDW